MTIFPQNFQNGHSSWASSRPVGSESFSGLTRANNSTHLVVHDTKSADGAKVSSLNSQSGQVEAVEIDWSRTDTPQDLEAVSYVDGQPGQFMAVEGSRYNGRTPHMVLFDYADGKGESLKQFDLPKLPYEVEGLVTQQRADGDVLVVLGGRGGDETSQGKLHWGLYDPDGQTMDWSDQGIQGATVRMPEKLGDNERPISDLHITPQGDLLAAGCTDNGDTGPFESLIYRVGRLDPEAHNPITLTLDHGHRVHGEKVEALDTNAAGAPHLLIGTDNESFGGTLQCLLGSV